MLERRLGNSASKPYFDWAIVLAVNSRWRCFPFPDICRASRAFAGFLYLFWLSSAAWWYLMTSSWFPDEIFCTLRNTNEEKSAYKSQRRQQSAFEGSGWLTFGVVFVQLVRRLLPLFHSVLERSNQAFHEDAAQRRWEDTWGRTGGAGGTEKHDPYLEKWRNLASMLRCLMHILVRAEPMSLVAPSQRQKQTVSVRIFKLGTSFSAADRIRFPSGDVSFRRHRVAPCGLKELMKETLVWGKERRFLTTAASPPPLPCCTHQIKPFPLWHSKTVWNDTFPLCRSVIKWLLKPVKLRPLSCLAAGSQAAVICSSTDPAVIWAT